MKPGKQPIVLKSFDTLSLDTIPLSQATPTTAPANPQSPPDHDLPDSGEPLAWTAKLDPAAAEEEQLDEPASHRGHWTRGRSILVVDDTPSIRDSLAKMLLDEGYQVEQAAEGEEALRKYAWHRFDLVILDLNLPGVNGWDIFQRMLSCNANQAVILITGQNLSYKEMFVGSSGVILEKPLNVSFLLQTVERIISESLSNRLLRVEVQRSFLRLTRPYVPSFLSFRAQRHDGLRD